MQQMVLIADLIACSTYFGHQYAHHQELESIIQVAAACRIWCLVFKVSVWCGAEGCVSGLRAAHKHPYKYSLQYTIPKHPQPTFLPQCERPSFTPIKTTGKIIVLYILIFSFGQQTGR
jgi:hypothetical protein